MKSPQPESARPTVVKAARRRSGNTLLPALKALGSLVTASSQGEPLQTLPFAAPRTVLNGRIRAQRRVATQTFALDRIQAIARKADVSVNDVFMAICGGALRRYLGEQGLLPSRSLTAGMPVSVRPAGDASVGNAVTFMHGSLGTDIADPVLRLKACRQSALLAKEHLQQMPRDVLVPYTLMLMAPYLGQVALGLGGFGRPMHNLIVSNVPGERQTQYLDGARLERCFPISTLFNGQALNISVYSCGGTFSLGFVGCRDTLPRMQKLAVYTGDALAELEASLK